MQNDSYQEQDSFRNENVLKLTMVMVAHICEYTKKPLMYTLNG